MLFQLDNHLWNVYPKLVPTLIARGTALEALSAKRWETMNYSIRQPLISARKEA